MEKRSTGEAVRELVAIGNELLEREKLQKKTLLEIAEGLGEDKTNLFAQKLLEVGTGSILGEEDKIEELVKFVKKLEEL